MVSLEKIASRLPPARQSRRFFVGSSVAVLCTWMLGTPLLSQAAAANTRNASAEKAFLQVSLILTGHTQLSPVQVGSIYQALVANDPTFAGQVQALQAFIAERKLTASSLQAALDNEQAAFAALPRRILQGWYVGVVGTGNEAKCIAYDDALMNVAVSDQLRPPSYAYGAYGTWSAQPLRKTGGNHG
jgi:hypothetical protein